MEKKEIEPITQEYLRQLTANPLRDSVVATKALLEELLRVKAQLTAQGAAIAALIQSHPEPGKALEEFLAQVDHLGESPQLMEAPARREETGAALASLRPLFEAAYGRATAAKG